MTAEIAIMNRVGVALAADSAVTFGGGEGKIYTSAEKLFQLSSVAPVGLMVYGNTSLVGVPWETLVKAYRVELGGKRYASVAEYGRAFMRFLSRRRKVFSAEAQMRDASAFAEWALADVREDVYSKLEKDCAGDVKVSEANIRKTVSQVIQGNLATVRKRKRIGGFTPKVRTNLRRSMGPSFRRIRTETFKKLPMTVEGKRDLVTICVEALTRAVFGPGTSGIAIAGFGEKEYAPSLVHIDIDGVIRDRPRWVVRNEHVIDDDTISAIIPFAQSEVVYTFMEGIDPRLERTINSTTSSLFFAVADAILSEVKDQTGEVSGGLRRKIDKGLKELLGDLFRKWKDQRRAVHWSPVTTMVSSLPKDELAAMAESMVNLTKFRRRISTERETVGGPIDVAVITKGDGFIWVKRKHYFDPWLNPRAMGRYLRETVEDGKRQKESI